MKRVLRFSGFLMWSLLCGTGILCANNTAWAQEVGVISGKVVSEAHSPLSGMNVVLAGTERRAVTDAQGDFLMVDVPVGNYVLKITGMGYRAENKEVLVPQNASVRVDIVLQLAVTELEKVQVRDTRGAGFEAAFEESKAVSSVSPEVAEDFNAINNYDALRSVPGMNFMWANGSRNGSPSSIRGGSSWVVPDVIDDYPSMREAGIGAEDGGLTVGLGAAIPVVAIRRLDVKKGSLGVAYAGDVDGGVIVNHLKTGSGDPSGSIWLSINPISEQLYMGDVGGSSGKFDYYVAAKVMNGGYQSIVDDAGRILNHDQFYSGLTKFGYTPREDVRFEFFSLISRDQIEYELPKADDDATAVDESTTLPHDLYRTTNKGGFFGLKLSHKVGPKLSYEAGYSLFLNSALRFFETGNVAHRDRPEKSHTGFANVYLDHQFSDSVIYYAKIGGEWTTHRLEENAQGATKEHNFRDYSVFFANSFVFNKQFFLNAGARYLDAHDDFMDQDFVAYDLGVAYKLPNVNTKFRAAYTTGYARNKGFAFFFGPIDVAGGVELSENATLEFGVSQPFETAHHIGSIDVAVFRSWHKNMPNFSGWGASTVYYDDHRTEGIEISFEDRIKDRVTVFGSFTHLGREITDTTHPNGNNVGNTGVPVPRYTGSLGVDLDLGNGFHLGMLGIYDDGMKNEVIDLTTGEVTITHNVDYKRLNGSFSYDMTQNETIRLGVENMLDTKDMGYSTETVGPNGYTFGQTQAEDPGRFVSLSFVKRF